MKDITQDVIDFANEAATRKLGLRSAKLAESTKRNRRSANDIKRLLSR